MTLREYILRWQEVYDKNQSRPTTYAAHGYIFKNHILPGLGEIPLSELTVEQVGDFLEERRHFGGHRPESPEYPGLGEHTMRHILRLLQQCLDQAIRDGLIADNPARRFHYPKPKKVSANVLTASEVEDYLDAAVSLSKAQEGQRQCTDGIRSGGLSGRGRAAGSPPHVPAGADGGTSAMRTDCSEMERPGCKRADTDHYGESLGGATGAGGV